MNIIIKLPNEIGERILSFPFLHILNQYMEERMQKSEAAEDKFQLHLISLDKGIDILNLLPFHAYYHELLDEDVISVFSVHRGCSDFKLPNELDIFISTTESMVDACIGKNLGAKEKIGFAKTFNNWFLSKQIQRKENKHKTEQICDLIKPLTGYISDIPVCSSRIIERNEEDADAPEYILLDVDVLEEEVNPVWRDLFDLSIGIHFILFSSNVDSFQQELRITTFIKSLPRKNTFEFYKFSSHLELAKKITFSYGCATLNPVVMLLASYCGVETVFFNKDYNFKTSGAQFLKGEVINTLITDYDDSDGFSKGFDHLLNLAEKNVQKSKESGSEPL